ncbi:PREDICTED: beta-defensin 125 [Ceratotherium simum simum]|uniref:Beta-defensin n=1 Tax=Ceratotherium simum simum TaxID=73337 RepID=A0ABM0I8F5_CERSS|nr:PREDICTED: beta-defensin 125 [Ceratotherium simum simum]
MNLPMLTFIICGLLTLVTKAGWGVRRCWKNNIGHCRQKCLHVERYKVLCMNKLSCCIPLTSSEDYNPWPVPPLIPTEEITVDFNTVDFFPNFPISMFDDAVSINTLEPEESTVTGTTTHQTKVSSQTVAHLLESTDGTTN